MADQTVYPPVAFGDQFVRLTVIGFPPPKNQKTMLLLRCKCGNVIERARVSVQSGKVKSCGCLKSDAIRLAKTTHGHAGTTDRTTEYRTWAEIKTRCYNTKRKCYPDYGGRGIRVCDRWLYGEGALSGFDCFFADMGPKPSPELTIERLDSTDHYSPVNCIWASRMHQNANRRTVVLVECQGERVCIAEAARRCGLEASTIERRRKLGWPESEWFLPTGLGKRRFRRAVKPSE